MMPSLRVLLTGIIDYAGLFPPAKLPIDQAICNYARYAGGADRWMLGRFVCPASRLAELTPFGDELFPSAPPFAFSALGRGGNDAAEFVAGLRADMDAIVHFRNRFGARVVVDAYETRLPAGAADDATTATQLLRQASDVIATRSQPAMSVFYETTPALDWRHSWGTIIEALAAAHQSTSADRPPPGFKWRAGGLEAAAFPSVEQLAFVIATCRDSGVAWKATAGLHAPFRHYDEGVKVIMHGFVNVFAAGVLAHARRLNETAIQSLIEDQIAAHFQFDDEGLSYNGHAATIAEIDSARQQAALSFGSCSFEEPGEHLRRLGWI
jgi:hypothetical protein